MEGHFSGISGISGMVKRRLIQACLDKTNLN